MSLGFDKKMFRHCTNYHSGAAVKSKAPGTGKSLQPFQQQHITSNVLHASDGRVIIQLYSIYTCTLG